MCLWPSGISRTYSAVRLSYGPGLPFRRSVIDRGEKGSFGEWGSEETSKLGRLQRTLRGRLQRIRTTHRIRINVLSRQQVTRGAIREGKRLEQHAKQGANVENPIAGDRGL